MATTLPIPAAIIVDAGTWRGRVLVPVLVYVCLIVAVVSSLGAPLVPAIAANYRVSLGNAQWSLTITLLVGALACPAIGRLGDGPRRRPVLLTCLGVLVAGSALAAIPGPFAFLLIGRAGQGFGLALVPLAMGVARDHLDTLRVRGALAILSISAVIGVGLGYPLTGLIAEHLDFHSAFWLAAVLGLVAMLAVALVVPPSSNRPRQQFDLVGALLLSLGLAALVIGISEGEDWGWGSRRIWALGVVAVVLLAVWVWHELRVKVPIVDLRLLRRPAVLTANVTGLLAGISMYVLMSMIIRYVQTPTSVSYGLGASVVVGGLLLLPLSAGSFLSNRVVSVLNRWISPARILPIGATLLALALLMFATSRTHLWELFIVMAIAGFGVGCSFAVMPRMIVSAVPPHETSSALALNQVVRTIGYAIGSAVSGTILTAHTVAPSVLPTNHGYTVSAVFAIGLCVVTAVVSFSLPTGPATAKSATPGPAPQLVIEESTGTDVIAIQLDQPQLSTQP